MKTIISAATAIYILKHGERLKRSLSDRDFGRFYLIFPTDKHWEVIYFPFGEKNRIYLEKGNSENEAFNIAYQHLIDHNPN